MRLYGGNQLNSLDIIHTLKKQKFPWRLNMFMNPNVSFLGKKRKKVLVHLIMENLKKIKNKKYFMKTKTNKQLPLGMIALLFNICIK